MKFLTIFDGKFVLKKLINFEFGPFVDLDSYQLFFQAFPHGNVSCVKVKMLAKIYKLPESGSKCSLIQMKIARLFHESYTDDDS